MSTEANKELARRFEEVWNKRNLDALDDMSAATVLANGQALDRNRYKQTFADVQAAVLDSQITIEDLLAEGEKVVMQWAIRGTQHGRRLGVTGAGQSITLKGVSIYRVQEGKIVEDVSGLINT
jgi:steroid delta-isomerase-like uncharacterized protein